VENNNQLRKWQPHDLRNSLRACVSEIRAYLQPFAILRFKLVSWLFTVTTIGSQKALSQQIKNEHCAARAEGIARLYLSGRKSLAFHNHFPILLQVPPHLSGHGSNIASAIIQSLCLIARDESIFSTALRMARKPARFCDYLNLSSASEHFAVLCNSRIFSIPMVAGNDPQSLQFLIESIVSISYDDQPTLKLRLGDCSALPRDNWHKTHQTHMANKTASREVFAALETLRNAAFLVCIDSDNHPEGLTALGKALRFENIANRFFDKGIQVIVFGNGECGFLCDHSIMDGVEAMGLAAKIHAHLPQSVIVGKVKSTVNPALVSHHEVKYQLSPTVATNIRSWFDVQLQNIYSLSLKNVSFNTQHISTQPYPADTLIQLAIQLCFFRCLGFIPSVFEPVSLSHLPGGRLDFISPVSEASIKLIQTIINKAPIQTQLKFLDQAAAHHRREIRIAKQGLGHIGHLLALTTLEFPTNQRIGATWLRMKESVFARIDPGSRLLTQRDVVASNGGYNPAVKLFGTMTHREDLFGIGYMIGPNGLTLDVQANGKYAKYGSAFTNEFASALEQIANIAAGHFLEANRAEAI
jgi:carnitine O-acetyltransferase